MEVIIVNNQSEIELNEINIKKISDFLFKKLEKEESSELNIVFIGSGEIREINKKYRNIDKETDVLSFSYMEDKKIFGFIDDAESFRDEFGFFTVGEILICPSVAQKNLKTYDRVWNLEKEIIFLVIHGMLHIYGYDHSSDDEKKLMETKQQELLEEAQKEFKI